MLIRQTVFTVLVALVLLILIFELVRRRKLREEYSFLWIVSGVSIFILAVWNDLLVLITSLIGAVAQTTTLFIFSILFLMLISLHFCVKISTLTDKVIKLSQELAVLKGKGC